MKINFSKINLNLLLSIPLRYKFFVKVVRIIFSRVYVRIFSIGLKVPKWHLNATYDARAYKNEVIKICKKFQANFVIEIGCGIGEIISRLDSSIKYGLDINRDTLILCKRLNKDIRTVKTDIMKNYNELIDIILSIDKDQTILLIMVNWLHEYSEKKVSMIFNIIFALDRKIIIVADIYARKELSKIVDNKIVHQFQNIKNITYYKRLINIDKVRDLAIISNFHI